MRSTQRPKSKSEIKAKINKIKRKKRRRARITRFTIFIVMVITGGYLLSKINISDIYNIHKNNGILAMVKVVDDIEPEVLASTDPVVQSLIKFSEYDSRVVEILNNLEFYPRDYLELLARKNETVDFVLGYKDFVEEGSKTNISVKGDYEKGSIPLFLQWDNRWGYEQYGEETIAIAGCGPTSLAMVAVGLTGNTSINPKVVADYSRENGYLVDGVGSKWSLMTEGAKHFGVTSKEIPLSKEVIISTLEAGQPIIASMGPGTFTKGGHFIVLTEIDSDGRILLNDPDSKINSEKSWDINELMQEADNLWAFRKM